MCVNIRIRNIRITSKYCKIYPFQLKLTHISIVYETLALHVVLFILVFSSFLYSYGHADIDEAVAPSQSTVRTISVVGILIFRYVQCVCLYVVENKFNCFWLFFFFLRKIHNHIGFNCHHSIQISNNHSHFRRRLRWSNAPMKQCRLMLNNDNDDDSKKKNNQKNKFKHCI